MANFLSDIFDSFSGQQATPQQTIIPTGDLLNRSYGILQNQVPNVAAYNNALQPVLTGIQLNNENQVFGPAANQVRQGAYQSILDELNLGNTVSPELQDLITTNTLQQLGSSGLGASDAGKIFGARSLLSAGLDLGRSRRNEALGAALQLPTSSYRPTPQGVMDVREIAQDVRGVQAAEDEYANLTEDIRRKNFSSLINTGGRILGTVAGGIFGGPMGASMGGNIGGSLFQGSGVAGRGGASGGSDGGFTSILNGLFNRGGSAIGGPNYGIGSYIGDVNTGAYGNFA